MRILISSGGTMVQIDPIRSICNHSRGYFGANIATAALREGMEVTYLVAENAHTPFSQHFNCLESSHLENNMKTLQALHTLCEQYSNHYHEYRYQSFKDYAEQLETRLKKDQPDIVIAAAAVSDYLVLNDAPEKISSNQPLTLYFKHAPKLIHFVKRWSPHSFLMGFKLRFDESDENLHQAAMHLFEQHEIDVVVANNLASIQRGAHEILLVERDGSFQKHQHHLAEAIIQRASMR